MQCFEILGIEPTKDKVLIKKAFAVKLKENPPDKDAEKYQQIREAYKQAIAYAQDGNVNTYNDKIDSSANVTTEHKIEIEKEVSSESKSRSEQKEKAAEEKTKAAEEKTKAAEDKTKAAEPEIDFETISKLREQMFKQNTQSIPDLLPFIPFRKMRSYTTKKAEEKKSQFNYRKFRLAVSIILAIIALLLKLGAL